MNKKEVQRQEKLNKLQEKHSELTRLKQKSKRTMNKAMAEIKEINKELKVLGSKIFDLKNIDGETPHITDHAIVRYLERVEGRDIWELKSRIIEHKNAVRIENTIVTINGEDEETNEGESNERT